MQKLYSMLCPGERPVSTYTHNKQMCAVKGITVVFLLYLLPLFVWTFWHFSGVVCLTVWRKRGRKERV